jgi:hypothetical protein
MGSSPGGATAIAGTSLVSRDNNAVCRESSGRIRGTYLVVDGGGKDFQWGAHLSQVAGGSHHPEPVTEDQSFVNIVTNEEHGGAQAFHLGAEFSLQAATDLRIERGKRFIHERFDSRLRGLRPTEPTLRTNPPPELRPTLSPYDQKPRTKNKKQK